MAFGREEAEDDAPSWSTRMRSETVMTARSLASCWSGAPHSRTHGGKQVQLSEGERSVGIPPSSSSALRTRVHPEVVLVLGVTNGEMARLRPATQRQRRSP